VDSVANKLDNPIIEIVASTFTYLMLLAGLRWSKSLTVLNKFAGLSWLVATLVLKQETIGLNQPICKFEAVISSRLQMALEALVANPHVEKAIGSFKTLQGEAVEIASQALQGLVGLATIMQEVETTYQLVVFFLAIVGAICLFKWRSSVFGLAKLACALWLVLSVMVVFQLCREASMMLGHQVCYEALVSLGEYLPLAWKSSGTHHHGWSLAKMIDTNPSKERIKAFVAATRSSTMGAAFDVSHIAIAAYANPRVMAGVLCTVLVASFLFLRRLRRSATLKQASNIPAGDFASRANRADENHVYEEPGHAAVDASSTSLGQQFFIGDDEGTSPNVKRQFFIGDVDEPTTEEEQKNSEESYSDILTHSAALSASGRRNHVNVPEVVPGDENEEVTLAAGFVPRRIHAAGLTVAPEDERGELSPRVSADVVPAALDCGAFHTKSVSDEVIGSCSPSKARPRPPPLSLVI